jgi:hypothetical protein
MNNEPLTPKHLQDLIDLVEPKTVYMNQKTYDAILEHIDFEPTNIIINNYLADNQALVLNQEQKEKMNKGYSPFNNVW